MSWDTLDFDSQLIGKMQGNISDLNIKLKNEEFFSETMKRIEQKTKIPTLHIDFDKLHFDPDIFKK
jgi:hypothetical protein